MLRLIAVRLGSDAVHYEEELFEGTLEEASRFWHEQMALRGLRFGQVLRRDGFVFLNLHHAAL